MGFEGDVCHLNEGHAALAVLERARHFREENAASFEQALLVTRAGNLFTTHTPVAAGFDRFDPVLVEHYLGRYAAELGLELDGLLALGRRDPHDSAEPFNMAYLAIRGSGAVNAVSRLHGEVSRKLFAPLFPRWPEREVPVGHVTNGAHMPSWESPQADELWEGACGWGRWEGDLATMEEDLRCVSDQQIWNFRCQARESLVHFARTRLEQQWTTFPTPSGGVTDCGRIFDPNTLTLGFARRFATYKRPNLLLHDPQRLQRLLTNPDRPVQLIIAGKAHPHDAAGKDMIREWVNFVRRPEIRPHAAFLSDYDIFLAQRLVQGVDVWINNPRRPWEASGTSGMKVLVNGGLNLSELDGWWAEAYSPEVGWALGDGQEHNEDPAWDASEAAALYELLEQTVVPAFYTRDSSGIPTRWVTLARESMARLTPRFSSNRMVREYTERYYLPRAAAYRKRLADPQTAQRLEHARQTLARAWGQLRFGEVTVKTLPDKHLFEAEVRLGEVRPEAVNVELYAEPFQSETPFRAAMVRGNRLPGPAIGYFYRGEAPATRPAGHFTPRIVPSQPDTAAPLEDAHILWPG